jgi:hypothetical protein
MINNCTISIPHDSLFIRLVQFPPLKHIFPRKLKNMKNKTITVETQHQIKHNTAQELHQINKITTYNLKKKKKNTTATQIEIHRRSPPLPKTQQPTNRESLSPFTTATQANSDERERGRGEAHLVAMRERSGSPGSAVASGWHRWFRRYLTVAFSLLSTVCSATHRTSAE